MAQSALTSAPDIASPRKRRGRAGSGHALEILWLGRRYAPAETSRGRAVQSGWRWWSLVRYRDDLYSVYCVGGFWRMKDASTYRNATPEEKIQERLDHGYEVREVTPYFRRVITTSFFLAMLTNGAGRKG